MKEFGSFQKIIVDKLSLGERKPKERSFGEIKQSAELSMGIIEYMTRYPFCTSEELLKAAGVEYHKSGNGDLVRLARLSVFTRDANAHAYKQLSDLCARRSQSLPQVFFDAIKDEPSYISQGRIEMGRLDNPFALEIYVHHDRDFGHIISRDAGGFYNSAIAIKLDGVETVASLVAINGPSKGSFPELAKKHELAHAHNHLVQSSLESVNRGKRWASNGTRGAFQKDIAVNVLSEAKDEAIAMLVGDRDVDTYLARLCVRGGIYDYVKDYKIADPAKEEEIWTRYQALLQPQLKAIGELRGHYVKHGLSEWKNLLPWFFRQIPIEEWKSTIERFRMIG